MVVSEEAAYWYLLCVKESSSIAQRRKFLGWLLRSPEHIAELFKVHRLDSTLRRIRPTYAVKRERPLSLKLAAAAGWLAVGAALALLALEYMQP